MSANIVDFFGHLCLFLREWSLSGLRMTFFFAFFAVLFFAVIFVLRCTHKGPFFEKSSCSPPPKKTKFLFTGGIK